MSRQDEDQVTKTKPDKRLFHRKNRKQYRKKINDFVLSLEECKLEDLEEDDFDVFEE